MTELVTAAESAVQTANNLACRWFTYEEDKPRDEWRSHADDALAARRWKGDCDDLASTALDLLVRQHPDIDLSRLYRMCVKSPECPPSVPYDHMVAGAMIRPGVLVIFGDTFAHPHTYARSPHRIMRYAPLSEGITWREGHP
jgi:hypothetical protein